MSDKERYVPVRRLLVLCLLVAAVVALEATEQGEPAYAARCCQSCPLDAGACEVTCAATCNNTTTGDDTGGAEECLYDCVAECEAAQRACFRSCVSCSGGGGGGGGGSQLCEFDGPYSGGNGSYWIAIYCPNGYNANCQSYGNGPGQTYCCDSYGCYYP